MVVCRAGRAGARVRAATQPQRRHYHPAHPPRLVRPAEGAERATEVHVLARADHGHRVRAADAGGAQAAAK